MTRWFVVIALLLFRAAWAGELTHKVVANESLESIAKQYYGSSWKSVYLAARNNVASPKDVIPGRKLVIPECWMYKVRSNDSLAKIAKKYLGDSERHKVLMQVNNLKSPTDLTTGQELLMPFHLTYVTQNTDTLATIARKYYRSSKNAQMIKDYNLVETPKVGQSLIIPIFDKAALNVKRSDENSPSVSTNVVESPEPELVVATPTVVVDKTPIKDDVKSPPVVSGESGNETPLPKPVMAPTASPLPGVDYHARLKRLLSGYRQGQFEEVCPQMENLLEIIGLNGTAGAALVSHLGFCAIAAGDTTAARDYFKKWLELNPQANLDPINTSPKILSVFQDVLREVNKEVADNKDTAP